MIKLHHHFLPYHLSSKLISRLTSLHLFENDILFLILFNFLFHTVTKHTITEISASQKGVLPYVYFEKSRPMQEIMR